MSGVDMGMTTGFKQQKVLSDQHSNQMVLPTEVSNYSLEYLEVTSYNKSNVFYGIIAG